MVKPKDVEDFRDHLNDLSCNYKLVFDSMKRLKRESEFQSLIKLSEEYLKNGTDRLERMKDTYADFAKEISTSCDNYITKVKVIEEEDQKEIERIKNDFEKKKEEVENEMMMKSEELNHKSLNSESKPSFVYRQFSKSKMDVDLVMKYPGSYIYREYMSDRRTADGDIFIDCDDENDELIVKYMKDDKSLEEDLKKMNNEKRAKLIDNLSYLELPIKENIIKQIGCNEDNEIMEAWKNRKVVMVNGKNDNEMNNLFEKHKLVSSTFNNEMLKNIQYDNQYHLFFIDKKMNYIDVIEDYLKNGKNMNIELSKKYDINDNDNIINEMKMIGIKLSKEKEKEIRDFFYHPMFITISNIIENTTYDRYLQKWAGNYMWKLIYRTAEHEWTSKSFHKYCDNVKGPTLIIIKSFHNWIFGGYTTKSWSGKCIV